MHITNHPAPIPGYCPVNLKTTDGEGFIDTGNRLKAVDPDVVISIAAVREMAAHIGLVDRKEVSEAMEKVVSLQSKVEQLEAEANEKDKELEAVETLRRRGFETARKPGRPPKPRKETVLDAN